MIDTQRLRDIAEPLVFAEIRALRTDRILRRTYQAPTETTSQASDAPMKAPATLLSTSQRKDNSKSQHAERAERGAGGVERGSLCAAAFAVEAGFLLAADFMLLDQRGAGAEDGGKSEKKTADGRSIAAAD